MLDRRSMLWASFFHLNSEVRTVSCMLVRKMLKKCTGGSRGQLHMVGFQGRGNKSQCHNNQLKCAIIEIQHISQNLSFYISINPRLTVESNSPAPYLFQVLTKGETSKIVTIPCRLDLYCCTYLRLT